jgi:tetratricopeptide (TPR) repeat protein
MKNYAGARPELERAVFLQPDLGEAYYQLGLAYRHLGEMQKAAEAMAAFQRFRTTEQSERTEVLRQAQQSVQAKP